MAATIEEFISQVSEDNSYYKFSIEEKDDIVQFPVDNVIYDYLTELEEIAVDVELTDMDMLKYAYKPWLLAYDVYGNSELEFVILALNHMVSAKEFNRNIIKMLHKSDMETYMTQIYTSEETYLTVMRNKLE